MRDVKEHIRKVLNSGTTDEWKEVMLKCSGEEINNLSEVYDSVLEEQVSYIEEQLFIELEASIHELSFIIRDFLMEVDFGAPSENIDIGVEAEETKEDYEPVKWDTNIKEDFKY